MVADDKSESCESIGYGLRKTLESGIEKCEYDLFSEERGLAAKPGATQLC